MLFDAIVLAGGRSSRLGGTPKAELRFRGSTLLTATVSTVAARGARRVVVVGAADAAAAAAAGAAAQGAVDSADTTAASEGGSRQGAVEHAETAASAAEVQAAAHASAGEHADTSAASTAEAMDGAPAGAAEQTVVIVAQEEPAFGGPGAGIAAGFAALQEASGGQEDSDFVLVLACDLPEVDGAVDALLTAVREHARLDRVDAVDGADGVMAADGDGRPQHLLALYRTPALAVAVERHRAAGDLDGLPVRRLVEGLALAAVPVPPGTADDVDTWDDAARHGIARPEQSDRPRAGDRAGGDRGDDAEQRAVLQRWVTRLAAELGLDGLEVDIDEVLALAGVAAHAVRRPAAPLTTFVVGYAAGLNAAIAAEEGRLDASGTATRAGDVARRLAAEYAIEAGAANARADARRTAPVEPTES